MLLRKRDPIRPLIDRMQDRLSSWNSVLPLLAVLPFSLALVLAGKILPAVNPRLGSPAEVIELSHNGNGGQILISVAFDQGGVVAIDGNRRIAQWKIDSKSSKDLTSLVTLLQKNMYESVLTSSLSSRSYPFQTRVVLAIDQHMRFGHIKPILYALAEAKVTQYSFETRGVANENGHGPEVGLIRKPGKSIW